MNATCDPNVSALFRGDGHWSPRETETVEPAFGPYHFPEGGVASAKRTQLDYLWNYYYFNLTSNSTKAVLRTCVVYLKKNLASIFTIHSASVVRSVTVGLRYGTGGFLLKSSVSDRLQFVCVA